MGNAEEEEEEEKCNNGMAMVEAEAGAMKGPAAVEVLRSVVVVVDMYDLPHVKHVMMQVENSPLERGDRRRKEEGPCPAWVLRLRSWALVALASGSATWEAEGGAC